jgi:hypothetical protein
MSGEVTKKKMGQYEGYFSDFLFKFCNNLLIKTKTHTV